MPTEIEVKFLNVNIEDIRLKLKQNKAVLKEPMRQMRRITIKTPQMRAEKALLRVRDEGDKVTMTYKRFENECVDGCQEVEIVVSDFQQTIDLLACIGFPSFTFQESKRETWLLEGTEVVIDEWPWIAPYIEIEGKCESDLRQAAQKLGFDWATASFGSVMRAYEAEYPHILETEFLLSDLPEVRFGADLPSALSTQEKSK